MSNCEKCGNNIHRICATCELCLPQDVTDQGIRSKILACPEFAASKVFDYAARDQIGGVL